MSTLNCYTLEQWINSYRNQPNIVSSFVEQVALSDGERAIFFGESTLLSKYQEELSPYLATAELNDRQAQFYAYNPRLFSQDLYGAPEFWYLVLLANELHSELDFHPQGRVRFYKSTVTDILGEIVKLERKRLDANQQDMSDVVVNGQPVNADVLEKFQLNSTVNTNLV